MISRFKPRMWIVAVSTHAATCQGLLFSYGVQPVLLPDDPPDWNEFTREWVRRHQLPGRGAVLVAGPSQRNPKANHRVELIELEPEATTERAPSSAPALH